MEQLYWIILEEKKKKKTKRRHDVVMQNVTAKMILNYFPCLKIGRKINNKVNLQ